MATDPMQPPNDPRSRPAPAGAPDAQTAADLVRQRVARIYGEEPSASQELTEAKRVYRRSKHQQFMYDLSTSGKDLAVVQTEWHNYYQGLPDNEKHQVWQEFYDSQPLLTDQPEASPQALSRHKHQATQTGQARAIATKPRKLRDARSPEEVQAAIRHKVSAGGKLQAKHHLQSVLFGLGIGLAVVIIFLFGFFNEVIIAPFIQPSRTTTGAPLIVSSSVAATAKPEIIIPKINVEIPVDYSQTSTNENVIEGALQDGVVHYPSTAVPGQDGNAAYFGHSSNNIFNKGKYKFAFVLLHELQTGDTFYLTYHSKVYAYKVISRTIVEPSQISVLGPVPGQTATATLITCDPPGTSLHRLIVVGQQVSPSPAGNSEATQANAGVDVTGLPGNGPTLWTRFARTTVGKTIIIGILAILFVLTIRWVNKPKHSSDI